MWSSSLIFGLVRARRSLVCCGSGAPRDTALLLLRMRACPKFPGGQLEPQTQGLRLCPARTALHTDQLIQSRCFITHPHSGGAPPLPALPLTSGDAALPDPVLGEAAVCWGETPTQKHHCSAEMNEGQ
ncbi:hypothetical protein AOLI_G00235000 [Acnodon oligacanthus]